MRRFNSPEKGALALAAVLMLGGAFMALFPSEKDIPHESLHYRVRGSEWIDHLSKGEVRLTGVFGILAGSGIVWLVFYGRKK